MWHMKDISQSSALPFTTVIHKLFGGLREREGWQAYPNVEKEELARTSTISDRQSPVQHAELYHIRMFGGHRNIDTAE